MLEHHPSSEHAEDVSRASTQPSSAHEYTPPTPEHAPARLLTTEKMHAAVQDLRDFLASKGIDKTLLEGSTPEKCFEQYSDMVESKDGAATKIDGLQGSQAVAALHARIQQMVQEAKGYFQQKLLTEKDGDTLRAHEASIARLEAALAVETKQSTQEETLPEPILSPAKPPVAREAQEATPKDLYGSLLGRLTESSPVQEPEYMTVAAAEAALAAAQFPEGHKYAGRFNNKLLGEQFGSFIRLNAGKADTGYTVLVSDVERDAAGKPKWILQGDKVVGFHVNDMGTRFQAHKQFAPGTETFTLKLESWEQADQIAKDQNSFQEKLRADFGAEGKQLYIAVNRGTQELIVRRMPQKKQEVVQAPAQPIAKPKRRPVNASRRPHPSRRGRPSTPRYRPATRQNAVEKPKTTAATSSGEKDRQIAAEAIVRMSQQAQQRHAAAQAIRQNLSRTDASSRQKLQAHAAQLEAEAKTLEKAMTNLHNQYEKKSSSQNSSTKRSVKPTTTQPKVRSRVDSSLPSGPVSPARTSPTSDLGMPSGPTSSRSELPASLRRVNKYGTPPGYENINP